MPLVANGEVQSRKDGVTRWKSDGAAATISTLGYAEGGCKYSIKASKGAIRNNARQFAHWKEYEDPVVDITVSKLIQDAETELLTSTAGNSFRLVAAGKTVATGTLHHEVKLAAATTTWDCAHFPNATLMNVGVNQGDPSTLELTFQAIGWPTFDQTPGT